MVAERLRQLISETGKGDDERAHAEDRADDEIPIADARCADDDVGERERRRHLPNEEDGQRAVAPQRAADAGYPFAANLLDPARPIQRPIAKPTDALASHPAIVYTGPSTGPTPRRLP